MKKNINVKKILEELNAYCSDKIEKEENRDFFDFFRSRLTLTFVADLSKYVLTDMEKFPALDPYDYFTGNLYLLEEIEIYISFIELPQLDRTYIADSVIDIIQLNQ